VDVPDIEADYDEPTLARLDRAGRVGHSHPAAPTAGRARWRHGAVAGGLLTGLALGLQEVFDPPPEEEIVLEIDVDGPPPPDQAVRFVMISGVPTASRIILRPWLAAT
jgi:hypothetical protein